LPVPPQKRYFKLEIARRSISGPAGKDEPVRRDLIVLQFTVTSFTMPPIGIYHQGSKLLHTLKSYYAKGAGMSSHFITTTPRIATLSVQYHLHLAETMSSG
jgi:hypothetical protein